MIQFPIVNVSIPSWDPKENYKRYILSGNMVYNVSEEQLHAFYVGHTFVDGQGNLFYIKSYRKSYRWFRPFMTRKLRERFKLQIVPTGHSMQFAEMQQHMYHQAICMAESGERFIDLSHIYNARSIHDLLG